MRQVIRFESNQPVTVALEYPDGINVVGRSGPQVKFSLTDNRIMYLDPEPARALSVLRVQLGELFSITKRTAPGKSPWWDFERVNTAGAAAGSWPSEAIHAQNPPNLPARPPESKPTPVSVPTPVVSAGEVKRIPPQSTPSQPPHPGGIHLTRTPPTKPSYEEAFRECLRIVREGLQDAGEAWSDHSVQAMTSTLFIQAAREGTMRFIAPKSERVA